MGIRTLYDKVVAIDQIRNAALTHAESYTAKSNDNAEFDLRILPRQAIILKSN